MKKIVTVLVIVAAGTLGVNYAIAKYKTKYDMLRKIYNETVIAYIQTQVGKLPPSDLAGLRAVVEKSNPKFITETAVDFGVVKDSSGTWRLKP